MQTLIRCINIVQDITFKIIRIIIEEGILGQPSACKNGISSIEAEDTNLVESPPENAKYNVKYWLLRNECIVKYTVVKTIVKMKYRILSILIIFIETQAKIIYIYSSLL